MTTKVAAVTAAMKMVAPREQRDWEDGWVDWKKEASSCGN